MSHRPQQVGKEILRSISLLIQDELPSEQYGMVTVTDVQVSGGLESAKIYVSSLEGHQSIVEVLNKKAGKFAEELKRMIMLRKIPQLIFRYDPAAHIEKLLEQS